MNIYDIILIAAGLISIPVVCAIWLDFSYSKGKKVAFSLPRMLGWYAAIFVISFIPAAFMIYNMRN